MPKSLLTTCRIVIPLVIVLWLAYDVQRSDPETLEKLQTQPKDWTKLAFAGFGLLLATSLSFIRWYFLVRALSLPFRLSDAFRLGFLGYMLNYVSLGAVGGDLFKAVFIAREHPRQRLPAAATVVIDRLIGLLALLVVSSIALLVTDAGKSSVQLQILSRGTFLLTGLGAVVIGTLLFLPGVTRLRLAVACIRFPCLGGTLQQLISAVEMYRHRKTLLLGLLAIGVSIHCLMALILFLAAHGAFSHAPTVAEHFVMVPIALVASALPVAPAGLGTYEFAMRYLYDHYPSCGIGQGQGLVVALIYRILTVFITMIGVVYYWTNRQVVREVMREADTA